MCTNVWFVLTLPQPETTTPENDIISFWNPNITINLVHDFTAYPQGGLPPHVSKGMMMILVIHVSLLW